MSPVAPQWNAAMPITIVPLRKPIETETIIKVTATLEPTEAPTQAGIKTSRY